MFAPRSEAEKESWWMSGVKECMQFYVLYRRAPGADVNLGKVACKRMEERWGGRAGATRVALSSK